MYAAFTRLVNLGLSVSWLVAAVLVLRLLLRRAPKWTRCLLWALVALRLLCPVSVESELSVFNLRPTAAESTPGAVEYVQYNEKTEKPALIWTSPALPAAEAGESPASQPASQPASMPAAAVKTHTTYLPPLMLVWAAGTGVMLLYALCSFLRLRRTVAPAVKLRENIYLCDELPSPFILGLLRPRIYLPSTLTAQQQTSVLAHEHAHLARRDHVWKPLGFLLLAVYWFNPLLWVAFFLLCRDIELACDERVIRNMSAGEKQEYSRALLSCSLPRQGVSACPLAFGEVGVKTRIRSILHDKKPGFWLVLLALLAVFALALGFLTAPKHEKTLQNTPKIEQNLPQNTSETAQNQPEITQNSPQNLPEAEQKLPQNPSEITQDLPQAASDSMLHAVLAQVRGQSVDVSLSLLVEGDMYFGSHPGWGVTNAVQCSRSLCDGAFAPAENEPAPERSGAQVTLRADGDAWSLTFWQGTNAVRLNVGSETADFTYLPQYEGENIGDVMRTWYDEAELNALGGGYENQDDIVIEDREQGWSKAVNEYVDLLYRCNTELVSPGSMFRYSYMAFTYENAIDATNAMRARGEIDENTVAFWLDVIFVPENERALGYSMAGNTVPYTGSDPDAPDGAYTYSRCGYVMRAEDGYHVRLVGTGW